MNRAQAGDTVHVMYTGKLTDGSVFDSNRGGAPLDFVLGSGQVIEGFDKAVVGLAVGETVTVNIPCNEAYGERREDLVWEVPKDKLPPDLDTQIGEQLELRMQAGAIPVTVVEATASTVTLDANHELAGQDLQFEIELVGIG